MALKIYCSMGKGLKLKLRKFSELFTTFGEATGEKLVMAGAFWPSVILNGVKPKNRLLLKV